MSEPSMAEVVRRLDDISKQQEQMLVRIDQLLRDVAQTYATKEALESQKAVHDVRLKELEKDNEANAAFRRQVAAGFIVGFLMVLVSLLGTVNNALGG